ncbi:transposase domain-containing protein [Nostoc parmelioides FACHB-3921]|uniref:Transposase domain-containing protein n=1 Tax=Nostoc parmelioides FACHB-3921 TaxID=2692909 RepID=A0ABR8BKZ5_9NOSO|nr:transposase domain-containing protein [Nostoc parmelioides FACHB-3921]
MVIRCCLGDVLKNLVSGLSREWTRLGQYWKAPSSSSISEARQRLGCRVMSQLFEKIVRPLGTPQTPGAFLGGLRVMAVDGTVMDVPDSAANTRVFGYPGSRKGTRAAFPKVRLVLLVEAGTHLIVDALMCPYRIGERVRALKLLRSCGQGMLLFFSKLILEILEQKIPPRQGRTNPRVVKKPRSMFPSRKPIHSGAGTKRQPLTFFILNTA